MTVVLMLSIMMHIILAVKMSIRGRISAPDQPAQAPAHFILSPRKGGEVRASGRVSTFRFHPHLSLSLEAKGTPRFAFCAGTSHHERLRPPEQFRDTSESWDTSASDPVFLSHSLYMRVTILPTRVKYFESDPIIR